MVRPCRHVAIVPGCHLCRLYQRNPRYRALWDGREGESAPCRLPCFFLGKVLSQSGPCPRLWLRACARLGQCTLEVCKQCPHYESLG